MNTFEQELSETEWTEILNGGSSIVFDVVADPDIEVYFNEVSTAPTGTGSPVKTWPNGWDFEAEGLSAGTQRIWAKGKNTIRGVRE